MNTKALPTLAAISCALLLVSALPATGHAAPKKAEKCVCFGPADVRDGDDDGVVDRLDHCVNTPKGCEVDEWGCQTDEDGDGVCDGLDQCPNTPRGEKVDKNGCSSVQRVGGSPQPAAPAADAKPTPHAPVEQPKPSAKVPEMERQLIEGGKIRLENVYFETNSANLLPESEATLNEAGETLEKFNNLKIEVQGHTDTRGSNAHNMRLSQARAESVRRYLLEHFHIGAAHYSAKGYGETQPETDERNDEELLRNRRVVLSVMNPEDLPRGVKVENKP